MAHNFRHQFEALGDTYAFVGVDPRGYGASRPPERDFPTGYFERDADDVLRVADALGLDSFSVLGWSAGANVGAVFAAKYPERVARLVLVNGNVRGVCLLLGIVRRAGLLKAPLFVSLLVRAGVRVGRRRRRVRQVR